ncbi:MAG: twitching motility protein PilT [Acidobacteria bacterium]|nr:MAG: twitching motility protein PilT [Acidobacteriota bacterium]PYV79030.1 MAG: twitching motility protein PilT [Acidobacteriota bacterium]
MSALAFFDTSILVYQDDTSSPAKQHCALAVFSEHFKKGTAVLSLQVLQEYFNAATRKLNLDPERAQRRVEIFALANIVRFEVTDVIAAIELHRLTHISFWDALIIHAARISGATVVYSEDFQHGSVLAGVRIRNPFIA